MDCFSRLRRHEFGGVAVYIDPLRPDWFVPSSRIDGLLSCLRKETTPEQGLNRFCLEQGIGLHEARAEYDQLAGQLGSREPRPYPGRSHCLRSGPPKELWFHVTDTCNLACRHCLFAASPAQQTTLDRDVLFTAIEEGAALGCRLFYFTGGEPFVYREFTEVLAHVQAQASDAHVVVLTNGLLLKEHLDGLIQLDPDRLHLQVSLDGLEETHDGLRGSGTFSALRENISAVRNRDLSLTISVAVNRANADQLPEIARQAAKMGASGLHLMFHFVRGKGGGDQFVDPEQLLAPILETAAVCRELGMQIDNLEGLKSQIFTLPGTRHDLSNMGWESMAVGPDGKIYPSPALVRIDELVCGHVEDGLARVFAESTMLTEIRNRSLVDDPNWRKNSFELLTGGGDPDHSWVTGGDFVGHDPYLPLYEQLMLALIVEQARLYPDQGMFRLRMGDVRYDCPQEEGSEVVLTHCNCVVSLSGADGHSSVREFYGAAARAANEDIVNPVAPAGEQDEFIPLVAKERSYGCGSPVRDAVPAVGETLIDLGSGSGVECFLAAKEVGAAGRVIGVDMTDDMLALAESSKKEVVAELGFDTVEFRKGFLEDIPVEDGCADVVISNCVINLSPDKRKTYLEILRVLKPGGRMVVADIVTDVPVTAAIGHSARWRGECLGGAMQQDTLVQMLEDCGFVGLRLHKRYLYREVRGNRFFSLTYEARKAEPVEEEDSVRVVYRGPHRGLQTENGTLLKRGCISLLPAQEAAGCDDSVFILDDTGAIINVEQEPCCCSTTPETVREKERKRAVPIRRHSRGCMVCGEELVYSNEARGRSCHFCGTMEKSNSVCTRGHFICDGCHQQEAIEVIRHICLQSSEQDMLALLATIRSHPAVPMHGPEHHAMMPGVILAACRNSGGPVSDEDILAGIERGGKVPGGACGFWGSCGAAIGAGIAAALILDATPLTPYPRQKAQAFSADILAAVAEIIGGRCCQRETWLVLNRTAALSQAYFGLSLLAEKVLHCSQYDCNRECIRKQCPLWENRVRQTDAALLPMTMAR
ncbi:MAG TPA: methyltransferase domain-containing protein [Desulfobulbus sp.]|nr:methyltransferase domain-containing protein [Desulfobulbus sp.]